MEILRGDIRIEKRLIACCQYTPNSVDQSSLTFSERTSCASQGIALAEPIEQHLIPLRPLSLAVAPEVGTG
jgi:hypothetical protein